MEPHRQTFIILHGRGSWAAKFGPPLLEHQLASTDDSTASDAQDGSLETLRSHFPHARFVFPSAALRRATIYKRALTRQWFDNWHLDQPATTREYLLIPGLRETTRFIHELLAKEERIVPGGASNIIIGGLSQGCAASLVALFLWEGEPPAAWFGLCGWLPFASTLADFCKTMKDMGEEEEDIFERDPEDNGGVDEIEPPAKAIRWLREELELLPPTKSEEQPKSASVPLFLGHGVDDDTVGVELGRSAVNVVRSLGYEAEWHEYEGLGHWYSAKMLRDLVSFLDARLPQA